MRPRCLQDCETLQICRTLSEPDWVICSLLLPHFCEEMPNCVILGYGQANGQVFVVFWMGKNIAIGLVRVQLQIKGEISVGTCRTVKPYRFAGLLRERADWVEF